MEHLIFGLRKPDFCYLSTREFLQYKLMLKLKCSRYRPGVAQRVGRGIVLFFHDSSTRRGWVVAALPGRTLPPGKTRYPLYWRLGGPQDRSGRAENLVPTGIWSRTVQPVVSRYTDWATQNTYKIKKVKLSCYRPGVAQRMGRGVALPFHDRGTRRGWVVSSTPQPHFTPGKDPVTIVQEAGWAPGSGLDGRKISSPPGFDPGPTRP